MKAFRAAVIGCGGRGRSHAHGYMACPDTELVACADPFEENAAKFAASFNVERTYQDYRAMLSEVQPDIVSVCTWTPMHHEMIVAASKAGAKAIHSEKPVALTWGEARDLAAVCEKNGTVLTFCHQRRFEAQFIEARRLAMEGAIGNVWRLEGFCPNLNDWGTHWFDMFFFYNGETPAEWVLGQIDVEKVHKVFDVPMETRGISHIHYANGVVGLLITGPMGGAHCSNRILGDRGVIEVEVQGGPRLRYMRHEDTQWQVPDLAGVAPHSDATTATVFDLVDALKTGREPELSARKALAATELIFGTYESSRRRGRVVLPLTVDDSPLITMLEQGLVGPQ